MTVVEWLESQREGFAELTDEEKRALADFALMWPYFEAEALGQDANFGRIVDLARGLEAEGRIDEGRLGPAMAYFVARYVSGVGKFTHHYPDLNLRAKDRALVNGVLLGKLTAPWERLAGALLIVYRYRNNLFHGPKWDYDIRGQQANFETATALLIATLEMRSG